MKIRKQTKKWKTSSEYITFVFLFYDAKNKNPQKVKNPKCLGSKNLRILLVYIWLWGIERSPHILTISWGWDKDAVRLKNVNKSAAE